MATIKRNSLLYYGPNASTYEQALMVSTNTTCTVLWQENGYYYVEIPSKGYRLYTDKDNITGAPASVQVRNVALQRRYVVSETADCRQGPGTSYASMPRPQFPLSVMYAWPVKENNYALIEYTPTGYSKKARAWFNANGLAESPRYPGNYTDGNSINAEGDTWSVRSPWNGLNFGSYEWTHGHLGVDIHRHASNGVSISGGNIYAAEAGRVAAKGFQSANGNYVVIEHSYAGKKYYSYYLHLASYKNKTNVEKGEAIAVMGRTGTASNGEHLHFALTNTLVSDGSISGYYRVNDVKTRFNGDYIDYDGIRYFNPAKYFSNGPSFITSNYGK